MRPIRFDGGGWLYFRPGRNAPVALEPLFSECGWNVEEVADSLGLGKKKFSRLTIECVGLNPKRWMREIRAVRGCRMVKAGWKISAVGRELGFTEHAHFTTEFKLMVGVSPSWLQARYAAWGREFEG